MYSDNCTAATSIKLSLQPASLLLQPRCFQCSKTRSRNFGRYIEIVVTSSVVITRSYCSIYSIILVGYSVHWCLNIREQSLCESLHESSHSLAEQSQRFADIDRVLTMLLLSILMKEEEVKQLSENRLYGKQ